jgi:hypothetical protein
MADVTGNLSFGNTLSFTTHFHIDQHLSLLRSTLDVPLNGSPHSAGQSFQSLLVCFK